MAGGAGFGCLGTTGSSKLQNPNCQTLKAAEQVGPPKNWALQKPPSFTAGAGRGGGVKYRESII